MKAKDTCGSARIFPPDDVIEQNAGYFGTTDVDTVHEFAVERPWHWRTARRDGFLRVKKQA